MSSNRRRARAGATVAAASGVPVALTSPDRLVWADADAVADLAAECGLEFVEPPQSVLRDPAMERLKAFRRAYAVANGLMSDRWPGMEDHRRLRELGVYAGTRNPAAALGWRRG